MAPDPWLYFVALIVVLLLAVIVCLSGCQSANDLPPYSNLRSRHGIRLRGKFAAKDVESIDRILDELPTAVVRGVSSISLIRNPDHFDGRDHRGHCHSTNDICIKASKIVNSNSAEIEDVLWHEVGHAYHNCLECNSSDFSFVWRKLSGEVYCQDHYAYDPEYPKDGILTGYGSRNMTEDIAVYMEACYRALAGQDVWLARLRLAFQQNDDRYKAKIKLLCKYGFITEADCLILINLDSKK